MGRSTVTWPVRVSSRIGPRSRTGAAWPPARRISARSQATSSSRTAWAGSRRPGVDALDPLVPAAAGGQHEDRHGVARGPPATQDGQPVHRRRPRYENHWRRRTRPPPGVPHPRRRPPCRRHNRHRPRSPTAGWPAPGSSSATRIRTPVSLRRLSRRRLSRRVVAVATFQPVALARYLRDLPVAAGAASGAQPGRRGDDRRASLDPGRTVLTGTLMTRGAGEALEDLHEGLATAVLVLVGLHVAGVLASSLPARREPGGRHGDRPQALQALSSARPPSDLVPQRP